VKLATPEDERAAWDAQAPDYATAQAAVWAEAGTDYERRALDCLTVIWPRLALDAGSTGWVLDLGCGVGRLLLPMAEALPSCRLMGVDISPRMVELARALAATRLVDADIVVGDGRRLPPVPPLAAAYSMLVFQHVSRLVTSSYIHQVADRLQPGGRFVFQFVAGPTASGMSVECEPEDVRRWCETGGLRVEQLEVGLIYPNWGWVTAVRA
jgi:cyclopropane fatty-acyl-phospholipid synthase-like methyltransferase